MVRVRLSLRNTAVSNAWAKRLLLEKKSLKYILIVAFSGEGGQSLGIVPGDIITQIGEIPHSRFRHQGDDLFYNAKIDLLTALAGG